jgi:hypothetical protein
METVIPFEETVVDDIHVTWPAGADMDENMDKWGWLPEGSPWADYPVRKIGADQDAVMAKLIADQEARWVEQDCEAVDDWNAAVDAIQEFPVFNQDMVITEWRKPESYEQAFEIANWVGQRINQFDGVIRPYLTDFIDSVSYCSRLENAQWEKRHKRKKFKEQFFPLDKS